MNKKKFYLKLPKCTHDWEWLHCLETHREVHDHPYEDEIVLNVTYRVKKCRHCGQEQFIPMWAD